ncbi:hypothetical protein BC830DRAFT_63249 [Chytriomyces sp. MP71]|nr:hypothetical protein BC830DRAFT_63249 [Chytriomyces sp. MP71]
MYAQPANPPPPPPMPPSYVAQWSAQYNRYFYVNTATGQSQWDMPQAQGHFAPPPGPPPPSQGPLYSQQPASMNSVASINSGPVGYSQPPPQYAMAQSGQVPPSQKPGGIMGMLSGGGNGSQGQGISTGAAVAGGALAGVVGLLAVGEAGKLASGALHHHPHHNHHHHNHHHGGW